MAIVAVDTNVLVGLLDNQDKWHPVAIALRDELNAAEVERENGQGIEGCS